MTDRVYEINELNELVLRIISGSGLANSYLRRQSTKLFGLPPQTGNNFVSRPHPYEIVNRPPERLGGINSLSSLISYTVVKAMHMDLGGLAQIAQDK
jgi:hypothetical protein